MNVQIPDALPVIMFEFLDTYNFAFKNENKRFNIMSIYLKISEFNQNFLLNDDRLVKDIFPIV